MPNPGWRLSTRTRRLLRWVERDARPLEAAPDALDAALGDAPVVFLGESDHFVHETHEMRRALLPYLAARGATAVVEEISASDGRRIQRYLSDRDPRWLDRASTFGDVSGLRSDRDDQLGGLLAASGYPFAAMRHEHQCTHDTIAGCGLAFYGVDLDATPGAAYDDVPGLARVPGETRSQEMLRLRQEVERRPEHAVAIGALIDGLALVEASQVATDWPEIAAAMAVREEGLYQRAEAALAQHPRAVVLGHVGHLTRDPAAMRMLDVLAGPPARTLGSRLAERRPVASIWMLHGEGTTAHAWGGAAGTHVLRRGTLNWWLAKVGDRFVLPIRGTAGEELLTPPMVATWSNGGRFEASLARQADALVFFRQVTPVQAA